MKKCLFYFFILNLISCTALKTNEDKNTLTQQIETAKINTQLGMAYLDMHNIERARRKLLLALTKAPSLPETWYSMAYLLETTGNISEANAHYLKAISLAPNRGDVHNNYGTFLCRQKKFAPSIQHFLLAVKDPHYLHIADAYENAGVCAKKQKDYNHAAAYFQKALAEDPDRPLSKMQLAAVKLALNNLRKVTA